MKKIVAEIWKHPQGFLSAAFYCCSAEGQLDDAVTHTLLSLIHDCDAQADQVLEKLVSDAESGQYKPADSAMPDWGVNDKNVWLARPFVKSGYMCVTNENTMYNADQEPACWQKFTYEQFRIALQHWRKFRILVSLKGKEELAGNPCEADFPEAR